MIQRRGPPIPTDGSLPNAASVFIIIFFHFFFFHFYIFFFFLNIRIMTKIPHRCSANLYIPLLPKSCPFLLFARYSFLPPRICLFSLVLVYT